MKLEPYRLSYRYLPVQRSLNGVGEKTAKILYYKYRIKTLYDFIKAAEDLYEKDKIIKTIVDNNTRILCKGSYDTTTKT